MNPVPFNRRVNASTHRAPIYMGAALLNVGVSATMRALGFVTQMLLCVTQCDLLDPWESPPKNGWHQQELG